MKITWPHMGSIEVVLTSIFDDLGLDYVLPPPSSNRTIELGAMYGPEFACFPLKTTLGNYIEAIERGADTLVMVAGMGPCRFGFYAETQRRILEELGYQFRMVTLEFHLRDLPLMARNVRLLKQGKSLLSVYRAVKFGFVKATVVDRIERQALHQRYLDERKGSTTSALKKAYTMIREASDYASLRKSEVDAMNLLQSVPKREVPNPVKIGIVGEFYLVLEPFFNLDMEEQLGNMGAYVERNIYLTDWLRPTGNNPIGGHHNRDSEAAARPYLTHTVGGEGIHSIGHTVIYSKEGFDGIVHLLPFTCMPETIAKAILPLVSRDLGIPVLSLVIDEQTGKAGVSTRLEAFVDLARSRRRHPKSSRVVVNTTLQATNA